MIVTRLLVLWNRRLYHEQIPMIFISSTGWVDFRTIEISEGLSEWKILMTPLEIETSTFRILAQCLNHLHHCAPPASHLSLEWSVTLISVFGFYLLPLHLSLDLHKTLIPVLSLSGTVTFFLGLTRDLDICPRFLSVTVTSFLGLT